MGWTGWTLCNKCLLCSFVCIRFVSELWPNISFKIDKLKGIVNAIYIYSFNFCGSIVDVYIYEVSTFNIFNFIMSLYVSAFANILFLRIVNFYTVYQIGEFNSID